MAARRIGAARLLAALAGAIALLGVAAQGAAAQVPHQVIYNSIPSPLPGNVASYGMEAYSMSQFGAQVTFAPASGQKNPYVTVLMSSWACEEGSWVNATCADPKPKRTFHWPVTITLKGGPSGTLTQTKKFKMPYRPASNPICAGPEFNSPGSWYDEAAKKCYHGIAFPITFKFGGKTTVGGQREEVLVSYNTSHHGPEPVGEGACNKTSAGCFYDSLNVGVTGPGAVTVGSNDDQSVLVNSQWSELYCGNSENLGTLRFVDCPSFYEEERPAFTVEAAKAG